MPFAISQGMGYLKPIKRLSATENKGSILQLLIARKAEVVSIPDPATGVVFGNIVFADGKNWIQWDTTIETPGTDSKGNITREGSSKSNGLKFSVPKERADIRAMFEKASEDEFIILYKDGNGITRLFGLIESPVRFRFNHSTGTRFADKNAYDCEFYYDGPDNMYEYNGTISVAPSGPSPSIVRYNGVAIASLAPGEQINIISEFGYTEFHITS